MFSISIENVQKLVERAYLPHAQAAFGAAGVDGIKTLLDTVRLIFQRCPPERLPGTLSVVFGLNATPLAPAISSLGAAQVCIDHAFVGRRLVESPIGSNAVVEIASDGTLRFLIVTAEIDLKKLARDSLVYRFDGPAERILAKHFEDFVPAVSPILKSNFASPTLSGLEEALRYYGDYALETNCRILKDVWEGGVDGPRLILVNKPEARMRDSLSQALELLLRDVTVKPEQNTDETKPVDIKINWFASGASALVEVKWLGKSTAKSQTAGPTSTYTEYGPPRAQAGANQLADYMDREIRHSNASAPRGYLVVFDARRKGTKGALDSLTELEAMSFAHNDLDFDPDHSKSRTDFAEPVRFFMNPRKSHFLPV